VLELREAAARSGAHRRTPGIVADLAAGFEAFLLFARSTGALTDGQCEEFWGQAWGALGEAARHQGDHQAGADPAQRFLELLRSAIASGRAHVADPDGDRPDAVGGSWGWRMNSFGTHEPKGDRVGWLFGDDLYLEADAAYGAAQRLGADAGGPPGGYPADASEAPARARDPAQHWRAPPNADRAPDLRGPAPRGSAPGGRNAVFSDLGARVGRTGAAGERTADRLLVRSCRLLVRCWSGLRVPPDHTKPPI